MKYWTLLLTLASCMVAQADPLPTGSTFPKSQVSLPNSQAELLTQEPEIEQVPQESQAPDLKFRGMFSTGYSQNFDRPADGINGLRGYDFADRKFKLDVLNLDFDYRLDQTGVLGARLDLTLGGSMPRIDAAAGLFRDPVSGGSNTIFDIRQAYLTYAFEGDSPVRIDIGKFSTPFGFEVMDGVDGINWNGTRTFSYTYSPYTHTGLRISYPIDEHLTVTGFAVLGADNFQDNNQSLSFGGQVHYHPTSDLSLVLNYLGGPEQPTPIPSHRQLLDFVANYQLSSTTAVGLHALTGTETSLGPMGSTAHWNGIVGYLRWKTTDNFFLNLRQEFFNDFDGVRTRTSQSVGSLTLSPEWQVTPDWTVRCDLRWDQSSAPAFYRQNDPVKHQSTIFFSQILKF